MKINVWVKILIAVLVLAGCAYGGYRYYVGQQEAEQAAAVETTKVVRMDMKSVVSATGTIQPKESVEVSSKITARIKQVLVKENDRVTAGQTIAILDGKDYEAQLQKAQYTVNNTRSKYDRTLYLHRIGAKSDEDLEDAQYNYKTAQSNLEETQTNLNETIITAPMDGIVVGEPQTPGTMAVQGTSNPTVILRIADLSAKQIKAKVDETDIGNVKVGQMATFTVDAFSGKTFTARVAKISQTDVSNTWNTTGSTSSSTSSASTASVIYYYVTLDVEDPEGLLLPAMTARVEINTSQRSDALAVPISALKTDKNGSYVLRLNADGTQETVYVKTGIYSDEYVEILEGVSEGDDIVISYSATAADTKKKLSHPGGPPPV